MGVCFWLMSGGWYRIRSLLRQGAEILSRSGRGCFYVWFPGNGSSVAISHVECTAPKHGIYGHVSQQPQSTARRQGMSTSLLVDGHGWFGNSGSWVYSSIGSDCLYSLYYYDSDISLYSPRDCPHPCSFWTIVPVIRIKRPIYNHRCRAGNGVTS